MILLGLAKYVLPSVGHAVKVLNLGHCDALTNGMVSDQNPALGTLTLKVKFMWNDIKTVNIFCFLFFFVSEGWTHLATSTIETVNMKTVHIIKAQNYGKC